MLGLAIGLIAAGAPITNEEPLSSMGSTTWPRAVRRLLGDDRPIR
ncbi:MAG TPA: hypothetical protein VG370_27835 [Chloroflexota bacterium]|nr:hypothetical protein [Chloroflexota bacterium]